ncbi:uncharacterized protein LOC141800713 [Halichoeres trimaculatus]|uniref:uncharacterized protein LOC141800713 n=1 Tax=Halichoeres trimaculatus TaxID=147232 RepID=UPI003D9DE268
MACADVDMDIHGDEEETHRAGRRESPIVRQYQATELLPGVTGPLHDLLQKQPAVLGSVQVVSGLLSIGLGFLFALAQDMTDSYFTMFRVSHLTGILFVIAGIISNLLFKYPKLLPASFGVNCGCIIVGTVAACMISVDLAEWKENNADFLKVEMLELCVLGLEVFLSAVLCFWFCKAKRTKSH